MYILLLMFKMSNVILSGLAGRLQQWLSQLSGPETSEEVLILNIKKVNSDLEHDTGCVNSFNI